jgi:hypothetical protein
MPFIPLTDYPDLQAVAAGHARISAEAPRQGKWLQWASDAADESGHCAFLDGDWTVFPAYVRSDRSWRQDLGLVGSGPGAAAALDRFFSQLPRRFPALTELLTAAPRIRYAGFSRLHARSRIDLHTHVNPETRILHIGIDLPPDGVAGLEVDGDVHLWQQPGDAVFFDDNLPHRAWNDADRDRIVLYVAAEPG